MTRGNEDSILLSHDRDSSTATITDCPRPKDHAVSLGLAHNYNSPIDSFPTFASELLHYESGSLKLLRSMESFQFELPPVDPHRFESPNALSTPLAANHNPSSHNSFKVAGSDLSDATVDTSPSSIDDQVEIDSSPSSPIDTISHRFNPHIGDSAPLDPSPASRSIGAMDASGASNRHASPGVQSASNSKSRDTLDASSYTLDPRTNPNILAGSEKASLETVQGNKSLGHPLHGNGHLTGQIKLPPKSDSALLKSGAMNDLSEPARGVKGHSSDFHANKADPLAVHSGPSDTHLKSDDFEDIQAAGLRSKELKRLSMVFTGVHDSRVDNPSTLSKGLQISRPNVMKDVDTVQKTEKGSQDASSIPQGATGLKNPESITRTERDARTSTEAELSPINGDGKGSQTLSVDTNVPNASTSSSHDHDGLSPLLSEIKPAFSNSLKPAPTIADPSDYFTSTHLNESPHPDLLGAASVPLRPNHSRIAPGLRLAPDVMLTEARRRDLGALPENPRLRSSFAVIRNSTRRRHGHGQSHAHLDDDRVLVGNRISEGHENFILAYNMLTGIRVAVSRNAGVMPKLGPLDFSSTMKLTFNTDGSETTPLSKYDFKFKDYAPNVFREMRALFGLDPADYLVSITGKYILLELGSPGKSGLFFYYSRDFRFIIKTIHHSEHKQLLRSLPQYYAHIKANPNTLISQFYGLHRIKMPTGHGGLRKVHFVVMNNLFAPHRDIHVKYDLKGSTWGRSTAVPPNANDVSHLTLKDLNWLDRKDYIQFGPRKQHLFFEQLDRDVAFLEQVNVMDYSLLLGIHDTKQGNSGDMAPKLSVFDPVLADKSDVINTEPRDIDRAHELPQHVYPGRSTYVFYGHDGGIRATDADNMPLPEIYYLGIIDCLTRYSFKKRAETLWRSLLHSRATISAVPAKEYGSRFLQFIKHGTRTIQRKLPAL